MGEKDVLGGGGDPLSEPGLSPEWRALIRTLWESNGKSIVELLPDIVALIKATKSAAMAERGLLTVLHSPKVQSKKLVLQEPAELTPGYQALKIYCDAAGQSPQPFPIQPRHRWQGRIRPSPLCLPSHSRSRLRSLRRWRLHCCSRARRRPRLHWSGPKRVLPRYLPPHLPRSRTTTRFPNRQN
jgi:hypothetical protein